MRAICPAFGPDNGSIEVSVLWSGRPVRQFAPTETGREDRRDD
jgi:hypothetical protein